MFADSIKAFVTAHLIIIAFRQVLYQLCQFLQARSCGKKCKKTVRDNVYYCG